MTQRAACAWHDLLPTNEAWEKGSMVWQNGHRLWNQIDLRSNPCSTLTSYVTLDKTLWICLCMFTLKDKDHLTDMVTLKIPCDSVWKFWPHEILKSSSPRIHLDTHFLDHKEVPTSAQEVHLCSEGLPSPLGWSHRIFWADTKSKITKTWTLRLRPRSRNSQHLPQEPARAATILQPC